MVGGSASAGDDDRSRRAGRAASDMARVRRRLVLTAIAVSLVAAACSPSKTASSGGDLPGGCTAVNIASSPEKFDLLKDLAGSFNKSKDAKVGGTCSGVVVNKVSS